MQKGSISVQAENIFPIIKQFLYSDHEIFLREIISNAVDATSKLKTLAARGDVKGEIGDTTIEVSVDKKNKTITISDKGIGMTEEEVVKYLNQLAFSSATEFLEKYKNESTIIGHFGLGFYSAFMVADKVEVVTRSYKRNKKGTTWTCEGDTSYTLEKNDRKDRGTDVILHISDDSTEFLEEGRIQGLLDKYCKFLPVPIKFGTKTETTWEGEGDDQKEIKTEVDNIINNPNPLWKKKASKIKDEEYRSFYNELYPYSTPPMFWIHLDIDFPFNLTGILYFPKLENSIEVQKNKIQLYSNQVFVTDEVKDIVPEFLTLLHGVIDSPDIPLNVSRSYLQSDSNVKKISGYITKKVADKLASLFKKKREDFESKWDDLGVFVKYGMLSEEKFHKKAMKFVLLKDVDGKLYTVEEFKEKTKANQTDKHEKLVMIYTNNQNGSDSYIQAAKNKGYTVLQFDNVIDNHFMQHMESKLGDVTFVRVDSDTVDNLVQKDEKIESVLSEKEQEKVKSLFESKVKEAGASITMTALSPDDQPVQITRPEFMRRMKEMQSLQGMGMGNFPDSYNVVVNTNHPLIAEKLLKMRSEEKKESFVSHLYDLARLNQGMLQGADLSAFVNKSLEFLK
ncbi:MAG TPA: molecular chaperone HtpG [Phaeodactylibacter sp.]|nr:molecular chaperone HtpG [Phaeodactylibacter sp.]